MLIEGRTVFGRPTKVAILFDLPARFGGSRKASNKKYFYFRIFSVNLFCLKPFDLK